MRAAFVRELGSPNAIRVASLPVPVPGPTDVLVRAEALAVNHVDTFVRSGAYPTATPFPFVIGRDLVGRVAAVGAGVTGFAPGDQTWSNSLGYAGRQGSFSEYAVVPEDRLYHLPPGTDAAEAVAMLHVAATAYVGLFRKAALRMGETVVVGGAGGGVGAAAVQLAAAAGATVLATAAEDDLDWCRSCGASEVVDYRHPRATQKLSRLAPDGVDVCWDTSGRGDLGSALSLLTAGGRLLVSAGLDRRATLRLGDMYTRDADVRGFAISNASAATLAEAASVINQRLARRALQVRIASRLNLSDAAEAHRLQEGARGRVRGRIVVLPSAPATG